MRKSGALCALDASLLAIGDVPFPHELCFFPSLLPYRVVDHGGRTVQMECEA